MAEYIDKRELIEFIKNTRLRLPYDSKDFHTRDLMLLNFEQYVSLMPVADVVEVRHGEWLSDVDLDNDTNEGENGCLIQCSVCGDLTPCEDRKNAIFFSLIRKYCPHCGAKTDLGDDE